MFKRDRKGSLLDKDGHKRRRRPTRRSSRRRVHLTSIHLDVGMHCVDCHFAQDMHGNGHIYGEVAAAVEIDCADCHGTADKYPTLRTSGPAARPGRHGHVAAAHAGRAQALRVARRQALPALGARSRARVGDDARQGHGDARATRTTTRRRRARSSCSGRRRQTGSGAPAPRELRARQRQDDVLLLPPLVDHELRAAATCRSRRTGRPSATTTKAARRATTRPTTRRWRATTCSSSARHGPVKGNAHRAGALVLGARALVDQHQPRAHLHPAAADRRERLLLAGLRAALPAHRAQDRDQDLHRLPRLAAGRQQRDHGAAAAARAPTS